jgi:hypothetical protein
VENTAVQAPEQSSLRELNKGPPYLKLIFPVTSGMPVVFIHCPYSNPHPPQMGRVWVENNYPLKEWGG